MASFWDWVKDNAVAIAGTVTMAVVTGGSSLVVQAACVGGAILVGSAIDADRKKQENENRQLSLKGEVSKEIRAEINNLQDERTQIASQANTIDQQIAQKQSKLNDPNTSETEKTQIRSEIATLISNRSSLEQKTKELDEKINTLLKNAQQTITDKGSGLEMDLQTKMIIAAVVFAIIYFMMIKDDGKR